MTIRVQKVLGVCVNCQTLHPAHRRDDLPDKVLQDPMGPYGMGESGHYTMVAHMMFGDTGPQCEGAGNMPQAIFPIYEQIVGKAPCGCVYHAEDGIPCVHDLALAGQDIMKGQEAR